LALPHFGNGFVAHILTNAFGNLPLNSMKNIIVEVWVGGGDKKLIVSL